MAHAAYLGGVFIIAFVASIGWHMAQSLVDFALSLIGGKNAGKEVG